MALCQGLNTTRLFFSPQREQVIHGFLFVRVTNVKKLKSRTADLTTRAPNPHWFRLNAMKCITRGKACGQFAFLICSVVCCPYCRHDPHKM